MFPDAEGQAIAYLAPHLDVPVTSEVPTPRPPQFVRVMRTGNRRLSTAHRSVQITLECWDAAGEAAAERFADHVESLVSDWEDVPDNEDGWISGPVPQRDPDSGCPRYVMTFVIIQTAT